LKSRGKIMKKALIFATIVLTSVAQAAPFVFPKTWTASSTTQTNQGMYRYATTVDFKSANPFLETGVTGIDSLISPRGLFITDPLTGDLLPYMAESYRVSANKLVWTVKLRQESKWSDGRQIVGDDWVITAKIHTSTEIITNRRDRFFVDGKPVQVTSPDPATVVFTFPKVVADALDTMSVVPWPAHVFEPILRTQGAAGIRAMWGSSEDPNKFVSAGAFKLSSFQLGDRFVAERNPYFGEWNVNSEGVALPYLKSVVQQLYKDRTTMMADYLKGELDQIETTLPTEVAQLQAAIKEGSLRGTLKLNAIPQTSTLAMSFNWNKASDEFKQDLFRNIIFRQAISHLMNREAMVTEAYGGLGKVAYSGMTDAFGDWAAPDLKVYKYNLDAARALLTKIGFYKLNSEGLLENRDGKTIEFNVIAPNTSVLYKQVFAVMLRDAKTIGIRINPEYVPTNILIAKILGSGKDRAWDAALFPRTYNSVSNYPLNGAAYSCKGRVHVIVNASGECLDPLETQAMLLFERGRQTLNTEERKAIAYKIQEVDQKLQPITHLVAPSIQVAWKERVQGELTDSRLNGIRFTELTWTN
jgi:peptide/nickel transport system substrate-binding protein